MPHSLNPIDAYALINLLVKEATGQDPAIQAVDSSSFVSVGETLLASGTENVMNALSRVTGRTFMAVRPYSAKLNLFNTINSDMFSERMRKISFYSKDAQASGWFNTDLHTQHATGLDNGVNQIEGGEISPTGGLPNMWEQNAGVPLELNFSGRDVWDDSITIYEDQLKVAFRDERSFSDFMAGIMTEKGNDIESQKEAFNRMTLLNYIGGLVNFASVNGNMAVDLKALFNQKYGTTYTSAQLLSTYYKEFLGFFVATVKKISDFMTVRSSQYHWSPAKTVNGTNYTLLRHSPKDRQRLILYKPMFIDAESEVFPAIFNPQYLDIGNYEGVSFWQNINNPSAVDVTPAIPNVTDPRTQAVGSRVQLDNVVGVMYDSDAIMVDYQLDSAYSTPVEARKGYRNIWYHFAKNSINDFTENGIVFYLGNDA